ncbi:MAG: hypothetical protein KC420_11315 [Myxococcales bacterium]|nr:hypothetical protein [Myxococcales bacterium]
MSRAGRPPATDLFDELAQGIAAGRTLRDVAEELGITYRQASIRMRNLRQELVRETNDAAWLDRTNVQVALGWLEHRGIER